MTTLTWTGERARNMGLLYQNYEDRAEVRDDDGAVIGEVLRLANGQYQPRVPGIMDLDQPTATDAVARVEYMHRRYRS
jgi:hypothetical protein